MRVFISYSHKNRVQVDNLHKGLLAHPRAPAGLVVWIDVKDMAVGLDLTAQMHEAISDSDVVVLCLSENYVGSKACMFEARLAKALKKATIPVVMMGQYPFGSDEIIEILGPGILRIEGNGDFVDKVVDSLPMPPSAPIPIPTPPSDVVVLDTGQGMSSGSSGSPGEMEARMFIAREGLTVEDLENLKNVARETPQLVSGLLPRKLSLAGRLALLRAANEVVTSRGRPRNFSAFS